MIRALRAAVTVSPTGPPCHIDCKPAPDHTPATGLTIVVLGVLTLMAAIAILVKVPRRESERRRAYHRSTVTFGRGLAVGGLAAVVFGGVLTAGALRGIDASKKKLRDDASLVRALAVGGPQRCRTLATVPPYGSPAAPALCGPNPRIDARTELMAAAPPLSAEVVFSPRFETDGEITVHDELNNRSLCVRIPDSEPAGGVAENAAIASGACPDAPVGAP